MRTIIVAFISWLFIVVPLVIFVNPIIVTDHRSAESFLLVIAEGLAAGFIGSYIDMKFLRRSLY